MLDIYTDYLICSFGQASATGLARLLSNEISHDAVTCFLSAEPKTSAALWHVVKPLVRQVERDDGVIIIDDSIEEKPSTDESELVSWHYDHSKDRTVTGGVHPQPVQPALFTPPCLVHMIYRPDAYERASRLDRRGHRCAHLSL